MPNDKLARLTIFISPFKVRTIMQIPLPPFEQYGVLFPLVVTKSDIFPINVPVTGFQLSDQLAFGYLPTVQEPDGLTL